MSQNKSKSSKVIAPVTGGGDSHLKPQFRKGYVKPVKGQAAGAGAAPEESKDVDYVPFSYGKCPCGERDITYDKDATLCNRCFALNIQEQRAAKAAALEAEAHPCWSGLCESDGSPCAGTGYGTHRPYCKFCNAMRTNEEVRRCRGVEGEDVCYKLNEYDPDLNKIPAWCSDCMQKKGHPCATPDCKFLCLNEYCSACTMAFQEERKKESHARYLERQSARSSGSSRGEKKTEVKKEFKPKYPFKCLTCNKTVPEEGTKCQGCKIRSGEAKSRKQLEAEAEQEVE